MQKIEQDIVERVFALGDRKISSLMTNRSDLIFLNADESMQTIRDVVKNDLHRIYPVYEKDKDRILGIVTLKDLYVSSQVENFTLRGHLKPANFLDQATSAYKALEQFKSSKIHYSLVANEYGLVLGIITLDDILKALVGDFSEFYAEDFPLTQRNDGSWLVDGQYPIVEFLRHFEIYKVKEIDEVNTVAGLVLKNMNRIPHTGETISWNGFEFEVLDLDGVKIDKILVKRK